MTWTWMDVLVTLLGVANLAALALIGWYALKIVRGPVVGTAGRAKGTVSKGLWLAQTIRQAVLENREEFTELLGSFKGLRRLLTLDAYVPAPEGSIVTVASVLGALQTVRTVRSTAAQALDILGRMRGRGKTAATAAVTTEASGKRAAVPAATPKPSLGVRLGLVPPAVRHLPMLLRAIRFGRTVLAEVRKRR